MVSISIKENDTHPNSTAKATIKTAMSKCPVDGQTAIPLWGSRRDLIVRRPIHAIIAVVLDPNGTHLALEFDHDVNALIQAAGDNGYVPSYFWIPWKTHTGPLRSEDSTSDESHEGSSGRLDQPGLIIFKKVDYEDFRSNYYDVTYLFLVGETPTLGINGAQFHGAFEYESELSSEFSKTEHASFATSIKSGSEERRAIIGPSDSGSAASLRGAIEKPGAIPARPNVHRTSLVEVAGSTQTILATKILNYEPSSNKSSQDGEIPIRYTSFSENAEFGKQQSGE